MSAPVHRVIVGCEYSGRVRDAFLRRGHEAVSCDLLPTDAPGPHYTGSVLDLLDYRTEVLPAYLSGPPTLAIFHPPCTDLAVSGARHFAAKIADGRQAAALEFVRILLAADVPRIALENPVSIISSAIRPADQYVQPWEYGHGETKKTGLWLKNLPQLRPTDVVPGREARVHLMPPGPDRWKERSRTFAGIAEAMAEQWGALPLDPGVPELFPAAGLLDGALS